MKHAEIFTCLVEEERWFVVVGEKAVYELDGPGVGEAGLGEQRNRIQR